MERIKIALFLILLACRTTFSFAGGDIMEKVSDGVCNCLEEGKQANLSIQNKQYQVCIQKATKVYIRQLKKIYLNKDDPNAEEKFATTIATKLAAVMAERCPDMLEFILEEIPELQLDN